MSMQKLSLGISPCPNDIFIFSGILLDEVPTDEVTFTVHYLDIEKLNMKAQQNELDVLKISYANYSRCQANYDLLESGGALGRGVGPLLLSGTGRWDPNQTVLVPGEHTTANFLLDFWAQRPLKKQFLAFDELYRYLCNTPEAQGVVIHEKRFTFTDDGLTLIRDLGTHWEESTGYPIPLGAVIVRKGLDKEKLTTTIRKSLSWAYANPERALALCAKHAADLTPQVMQSHIDLYVNEFTDSLGVEGEKAVSYFLQQQALLRANELVP